MNEKPAPIDADAQPVAKELFLDGEPLTIGGMIAAGHPCERHCSVCEGLDHHWLDDCADSGEPIEVCKHCAAWRPYCDDEDRHESDE